MTAQQNEVLTYQVCRLDAPAAFEGMASRHDADRLGVDAQQHLQPGIQGRVAHHGEIGLAPEHGHFVGFVAADQHLYRNIGVVVQKGIDDGGHDRLRHRTGQLHADKRAAHAAQPQLIDMALQRLGRLDHALDIRQQRIRLRTGVQPPLAPLEQRQAQVSLELAEQPADRRLRQPQALGGRDGRARGHKGQEGLQLFEIHFIPACAKGTPLPRVNTKFVVFHIG